MVDPKLYSLLAIYECGSFLGAAKKLSITQPAVSQHIKLLESELGVRIFDRANGKVIVTKKGESVIRCARKMVALEKNLTEELAKNEKTPNNLTVGITHTSESNQIVEALAKYCSETGGTTIKIITDSISNLYTKLKSYEIDLAIVEGRIHDAGVKYIMLDTDYLVLATSPNHPFAKRSMVTLNELRRERMILRLPNSATRNLFVAHLESSNMRLEDFNVILEVDNVATIKDLIRRDFGVSILPKSVCLDELKKGKMAVIPVENLSMMREINIAYQADFTQTDILHGIIQSYNETKKIYE